MDFEDIPMSELRVLQHTMMLRFVKGRLQQLFVDSLTGEHVWKDVPSFDDREDG